MRKFAFLVFLIAIAFFFACILACQVESFDISFVAAPASKNPLSNRFSATDLQDFFSPSEIQMKNTLTTPLYCVDAREGIFFACHSKFFF